MFYSRENTAVISKRKISIKQFFLVLRLQKKIFKKNSSLKTNILGIRRFYRVSTGIRYWVRASDGSVKFLRTDALETENDIQFCKYIYFYSYMFID